MREAKAKELTIVLIGRFNPVIINPNWLAGKKLISDQEAKGAIEGSNFINHPEISQFRLSDCDIQIQTLLDRYMISSKQEGYFGKLHELTEGIFNFLRETPISQLGINTVHHYEFENEAIWNKFGHMLAPKEPWLPVTKTPGLKRLEMISAREDGLAGEINTSVGISEIFQKYGIRIQVNDHYNLYTLEELSIGKNINAQKSMEILEKWSERLQYPLKIINGVINYEKK